MLVSELIEWINSDIVNFDEMDAASTDYTENPLPYINRSIDFLSDTLIDYQDPLSVVEVDIAPSLPVPKNFVQFAPKNGFPVYITSLTGTSIFMTTSGNTVRCKYYVRKPHVTSVTQEVPFADCYCGILSQIAALFILNRNEADITSDSGLLTQVLAALKAAKGG